jgi:sugar phosphate isomerase/epimerase
MNRSRGAVTGFSTGFASTGPGGAAGVMDALKAAGAGAVELDYRLTASRLRELAPLLRSEGMPVLSLHNFCPIPPVLGDARGGGDLFSLSDRDADLRRAAVDWTTRTIEWAHELAAGAVVLHCGAVVMDHREDVWHSHLRQGRLATDGARAFVEARLDQLRRSRPPFLDALMFSLDRLVREAERYGVVLGLENRFHYHELPGPEDFEGLFNAFQGAPLGYWHDLGHAHAAEIMGTGGGQWMMDRFSDRLVGVHVHDAAGLADHRPPGEGEIDFRVLAPCCDKGVRLVMELRPGTPPEAAAAGFQHLEAVLGLEASSRARPPER